MHYRAFMDDSYLVSINKLQEIIDTLYPILLNNNLDEKRENLDAINGSITQLESKKIPVPDDLYQMQKDLRIEISRMESAKETLLYLSSTFSQFQSQLEPLLKVTTPSRPRSGKRIISPANKLSKGPLESPNERPIREKIQGFTFTGKDYSVDTWIDFYMGVCGLLYKEHSDVFDRVLTLKGAKRPYFAKDPAILWMPKKIPGTDMFLESHLNAMMLRNNAIKLIKLFGYTEEDLQIRVTQIIRQKN